MNELESKMQKTLEVLQTNLAGVRAGRANPGLVENVKVSVYGSLMAMNQVASISVQGAKGLVITPFDANNINPIEKAISDAKLGLTPRNDGRVIHLNIPNLTEERRKELLKQAKAECENTKVTVRNLRRDFLDKLKKREKAENLAKDDLIHQQELAQRATDKYIHKIDELFHHKEKDILEV